MSLRTWKKEFYPKPAHMAAHSTLAAVRHSLRKWRGLRPGNLARHDLAYHALRITEVPSAGKSAAFLPITSSSCALCFRFLSGSSVSCRRGYNEDGERCPLYALRDCRCDEVGNDDELFSPWSLFISKQEPERMIRLLERALALVNRRRRKVTE